MADETVVGPIDPDEIKVVRAPFGDELVAQGSGLTLAAAHATTVKVLSGTDANAAQLIVGDPVIDGTDVLQRIKGRLDGVAYRLKFKATDSAGGIHVAKVRVEVRD